MYLAVIIKGLFVFMIVQIKNTKRYFISSDGYCFKMDGVKETPINLQKIRGVHKVKIEHRRLGLVNLMLEYFYTDLPEHYKITYKVTDGKIPLKNIKIKALNPESNDDILINKFKCDIKASSSNSRVKFTSVISTLDVLNCLKRSEFKCFYCGSGIKHTSWHLDHVTPLCMGGLNSNENIAASCKTCNLMKGGVSIQKFLHQCKLITQNNI